MQRRDVMRSWYLASLVKRYHTWPTHHAETVAEHSPVIQGRRQLNLKCHQGTPFTGKPDLSQRADGPRAPANSLNSRYCRWRYSSLSLINSL